MSNLYRSAIFIPQILRYKLRYVISPTDVHQHSLYHLHIYPVISQEA